MAPTQQHPFPLFLLLGQDLFSLLNKIRTVSSPLFFFLFFSPPLPVFAYFLPS